ncbi:N-acetylglucosamine-6-phosphate deacetylase [Lederbergia wuyishanensis]|uniref:N-acetylglucosamine-6-phosphate deacetylase n=1 Tax=Lederbergia wuyishanensis TaxID=1347903 RepID=A0ABU0DA15_9BACI|nr:N-acetylglucosamine-6-phosphate deacetylase [Lederbergia wuyishanensis]MCJ8009925.1 N-acetylglucosamine-6-phosphate deacetylase [Lederbergia wuyishanensis]MDQ0345272.1 N-acetylglucosamine-6-phosphate deacetylase [Lederbergia wuyishanensis]
MHTEGKTLYVNGKIYTGLDIYENGQMLVADDGKIIDVSNEQIDSSDANVIDLKRQVVVPGFVDVHIHGGNGYEVMGGTEKDLDEVSKFHASFGTTSFLASTAAASNEDLVQVLQSCSASFKKGVSCAELLGVHLEGPFINEKARGAMDIQQIRLPDLTEMEQLIEVSGDTIRIVTLAPEVEGGLELVAYLHDRGITVSIGHSYASYEEMLESLEHGVRHTTHHFNGMRGLHHRDPGVAGTGLMLNELTLELIADGIHVHPAVVKFLFQTKGANKVCVITDAVKSTGLADGEYDDVQVKDGKIFLKEHPETLAGSSLTMMIGLRNVLRYAGLPLEKVLPSFTIVPAKKAKVANRKGSLERGKDADFLILNEDINLVSTFVKGKKVFEKRCQPC